MSLTPVFQSPTLNCIIPTTSLIRLRAHFQLHRSTSALRRVAVKSSDEPAGEEQLFQLATRQPRLQEAQAWSACPSRQLR